MLTTSFLIESLSFFMTLISPKIPTLITSNMTRSISITSIQPNVKQSSTLKKPTFRDLPRLAEALQLPPTFHCQQRTVFDSMEGLCMLLKRVSYPCRYSDMIPRFGRPVSVLSLITNHTLDYIYENHGHLITQWNRNILNPRALQSYADSISRKGAPLNNCFGFIDGTVRPISRPGHAQRVVYNGHKRVHSLKFQSLALPNGLIGNIFGPVGKYE